METTTVRTIHHAAHFQGSNRAGDILEIDTTADWQPGDMYPQVALDHLAEYHHGYIDKEGAQHWVFTRSRAADPGSVCDRCKEVQ